MYLTRNNTRRLIESSLVILLLISGLIGYYWPIFHSGFTLFIGDDWDGRLNLLLADSWRDYFNGALPFPELRTFYPVTWMRCGTDLNLTLYLLEAPFRWLGADYIQAGTCVQFCLHFQAGVVSYCLFRKVLKTNAWYSLLGVVLVCFSNALRVKLLHTQFFFFLLTPLLTLCIIQYFRKYHIDDKVNRILWGFLAILTYGMIIYSCFYPAFFIGLFGLFFLAVILTGTRHCWRHLLFWLERRGMETFLLFIVLVLVMFPFIYLYLPEIGGKGWDMQFIRPGMPVLTDIMQCGPHNMLWGWLVKYFPLGEMATAEHHCGFPILTFLTLIWCVHVLFRKQEQKRLPSLLKSLVVTLIVAWLSTVSICGFSIWYILMKLIPGASAIRSLSRFYLFLTMPVSLCIVLILARQKASLFRRCAWLVLAVLLLDNVNLSSLCLFSRPHSLERIAAVPAPPEDAKVFVINFKNSPQPRIKEFPGHPWPEYGLLAMEIAQKYKLFTFNGYTGNVRDSNWLFYDPHKPYYRPYVESWIKYGMVTAPVYDYDPCLRLWRRK